MTSRDFVGKCVASKLVSSEGSLIPTWASLGLIHLELFHEEINGEEGGKLKIFIIFL